MGCFNAKNITTDKPYEEKTKELNKLKGGSAEKSKNVVTSKTGFSINTCDLVGEKTGNINLSYNLLMPPLGKGYNHTKIWQKNLNFFFLIIKELLVKLERQYIRKQE